MQNSVAHLLVEVLGVVMEKTQILTETWSGIFQCNTVPRKTSQVLDYLLKQKMGAHCIYHMGLCGHCWSTMWCILRKTMRKEIVREARETRGLESTIYNERLTLAY